MKKKEWNEGLNRLDPTLVEKYVVQKDRLRQQHKQTKRLWLRIGAAAACFILIISAVFVLPMLQTHSNPNISAEDTRWPSSAPQYYGMEATGGGSLSMEVNTEGISVTARLLSVLPDTYTFYDDWSQTEFHLLKMETLTLLKGEKMADTFYYIVPERFMTDFTIFDKFVIEDMGQYGYDHSVLYNKTQNCAEQLDAVLFGYVNIYSQYMGSSFMAFDSDGNFDGRLWGANEYWKASTGWPNDTNDAKGYPKYLNGYTIAQAEQDYSADGNRYVHTLDRVTGEAADALEYIKSFENGLFIPRGDGDKLSNSPEVQLSVRRYIDGFTTNESGMIYADSVIWSNARFSKDDVHSLPNLSSAYAAVISAFEAGNIHPPHILKYSEMKNTDHGIFGWYAKTEEGIIGIIRVTWCYRSNYYDLYYDDAYYIIEYGSNEYKPIDRDSLLKKFGEYESTFIYTGAYDALGKVDVHRGKYVMS